MKAQSKQTILIHTLASIFISALVFYFSKDIGRAMFFSSLTFNIYLRLLCFNFNALKIPGIEEKTDKANSITAIFSSFRVALVAAVLATLILKFNFNLYGLGLGFLLYQLILIGSGFFNAHHQRNTR